MWITEHGEGRFVYGRKNSKESGRVLADSERPSTVTCVAVSRGSTTLSQTNNRNGSATDTDQSLEDVEEWTDIQTKVL